MSVVESGRSSVCQAMASPLPGSDRITELDGLRGIAILVVIAKHYGVYDWPGVAGTFAGDVMSRVFPELYAPDLFLVLTGFLLGRRLLSAINGPHYYSNFYLRRVCRTFPLYYLLLGCFTAGVLAREALSPLLWLDLEWPFGTPWSMAAYAAFLQSFWIAAKGSLGPQWLAITWTLAVQEQFYVALPCLVRWTPQRALGWLLVALFLVAPLCRWHVLEAVPAGDRYGYEFLIFCRSDTLAIGVLAAWLVQSPWVHKGLIRMRRLLCPAAALLFLGFAWATYSGYDWSNPTVFVIGHSYRALMYVLMVLTACFATDGITGAVLRNEVLRELGRISYGLFLFHQMVRDLFFRAAFGMPPQLNDWETWLATAEAFVLTVFVAEFCWHYIEKPLIVWSRSK